VQTREDSHRAQEPSVRLARHRWLCLNGYLDGPQPTHATNVTTSVGHRLNEPMPDHARMGYLVSVMLGRLAAAPLSGAVSV